jgi:L-rhamnose mutarotase
MVGTWRCTYHFTILRLEKRREMIKGFKMHLRPGMEAEYEKRHNEIWPEMREMIKRHGGKNYSIFLDRETLTLFGSIEILDEELWLKSTYTAVNKKWCEFMADIMETYPDNSPVSQDLTLVFHLD